MQWALDLGTTNSGLAYWDENNSRAELLLLPGLCRRDSGSPLEAPRMIPSSVHVLEADVWARLGRLPFLRRHLFLGQEALIGRPALEKNQGFHSPAFAPSFKMALSMEPTRPLARIGKNRYSARDIAKFFLRELSHAAQQSTGQRIRDLTVTVPVESYDTYRAEILALSQDLGIQRLRFLDEPVAAAVGYGLGIDRPREVLVFDMGGGTLHAARVLLSPRGIEAGRCEVRAKAGCALGGNTVDIWLMQDILRQLEIKTSEIHDESEGLWRNMMLAEARRVKEALHFELEAHFILTAPEELRGISARLAGRPTRFSLQSKDLLQLLEREGLFQRIHAVLDDVGGEPEEVLVVGGSTLLPGVHALLEQRFGRDRIRSWTPFEAVVLGAAAHAAGRFVQSDLIVHDYAMLTHDVRTGTPGQTIIIPRGTRFPTPKDFWHRPMVPTCALGEPESVFKLVIYEVGKGARDARRFGWDAGGQLKVLDTEDQILVPLNADNPTLGILDPPHPPQDRHPRLDVYFGINADRWLIATIKDLKSGKQLLDARPVVRLL